MAGPENTFIASVHRHLPAGLYRMKNHNQYNGGIADVWYSGDAADLWVEYKFLKLPSRLTTSIELGLSELQKAWLRARHKEGRSVGVIAGAKEGGVWFPGVTWDQAMNAEFFRSKLMDRNALARTINDMCSRN